MRLDVDDGDAADGGSCGVVRPRLSDTACADRIVAPLAASAVLALAAAVAHDLGARTACDDARGEAEDADASTAGEECAL